MSCLIPIGDQVIPVCKDVSGLYMGRSKMITTDYLVTEICPVPEILDGEVHASYRFSPFKTPMNYTDRLHHHGGHQSAEITSHICFGFLFKYGHLKYTP